MNTLRSRSQAIGLVAIGILLLLAQTFRWNLGEVGWPLFVLVPGLLFLAAAAFGGRSVAGLFVPGSVVTTVGLILFVQNLSGRFETWAYAWALIPTAIGVGLSLQGARTEDPALRRRGRQLIGTFLLAFLAFAVFFEGFIFGDIVETWADTWLFRSLLPLLLIAAGAYLLWRQEAGPGEGS